MNKQLGELNYHIVENADGETVKVVYLDDLKSVVKNRETEHRLKRVCREVAYWRALEHKQVAAANTFYRSVCVIGGQVDELAKLYKELESLEVN